MRRNPAFWRELYIRGGMMAIVAAIAYFILGADAWVWLIPVAVSALVAAKWLLRPKSMPDENDAEES